MENCHTSQDHHHSTCQTGFNRFQGISLQPCPSEQYCIVQGPSFFLTVMVGFHFQVATFYSTYHTPTPPHRPTVIDTHGDPHIDITPTYSGSPTHTDAYRDSPSSWKMLRPRKLWNIFIVTVLGKRQKFAPAFAYVFLRISPPYLTLFLFYQENVAEGKNLH